MSSTLEQIQVRAKAWREALEQGELMMCESTVGGGSLPDESVATFVLALDVKSPDQFLKKLRAARPPIIARTENDKILFDPRTVLDDERFLAALKPLLSENS